MRAITDSASPDHAIFFGVRLPRVLMGAVVGAVLASVGRGAAGAGAQSARRGRHPGNLRRRRARRDRRAGAAFQRVPSPTRSFRSSRSVPRWLATLAVYRLALIDGRLEPFTLLLIGVIFNAFWGAAIMLVNSIVNFYYAHSILFWLMGNLEAPSYREVAIVAMFAAVGFAVLMLRARDLNLLSLGDEAAAEMGVEVEQLRRIIFFATSMMIGAAVSVSGIISFVGLIVPHMLRLALGADHRLLLPASLLGGAAFMVIADLVARTAIAPAEIPVGAITALCGGPFFIYMLRRQGRRPFSL